MNEFQHKNDVEQVNSTEQSYLSELDTTHNIIDNWWSKSAHESQYTNWNASSGFHGMQDFPTTLMCSYGRTNFRRQLSAASCSSMVSFINRTYSANYGVIIREKNLALTHRAHKIWSVPCRLQHKASCARTAWLKRGRWCFKIQQTWTINAISIVRNVTDVHKTDTARNDNTQLV